jgi:hypothetical protein
MNIEKIKNYNQKMLALLSSILVLLAAIGLISLIVVLIQNLIPHHYNSQNTLLSADKADKLKQDSLRLQIVSYSSPQLADTNNLIYIISVDVKTLDHPELYSEDYAEDESDSYSKGSFGPTEVRSRSFYGSFINLLEYDYKNNTTRKICNERIVGNDMSFQNFSDEILVVFKASSKDSDGDGKVTTYDFNSLFIYSLRDKNLRKIEYPNSTVESYENIGNTKDLLITFGYDRNNDKVIDETIEPTFIMKYDYAKGSLVSIVDKSLGTEVQKIIDNK